MKAVILAAGRGSRMGLSTTERPKCLVELAGRALLEWQMAALAGAGITEVGVVTGYKGEMLETYPVHIFTNQRWAETNMVASLLCAGGWLEEGPCLISYADIFYPASAVRELAASHHDIAITYDREWLKLWRRRFDDPLGDAETFRLDGRGDLLEIGAKAENPNAIEGQYMGLLKFTPGGWGQVIDLLSKLVPAERDRLDMTALLSRLLDRGARIGAVAVAGDWGEVDHESDLELYERMVTAGEIRLVG